MARVAKGRIVAVTSEVEKVILERLASGQDGSRSLRQICEDESLPHRDTVNEHLKRSATFAAAYVTAKTEGLEARFERMSKLIADEKDVQRARLLWDNERWQLSKLAPKVYGDKQTVEHTDPQGNNPFAALMEAVSSNGRPRPGS